jgi:hypothetical protein
VLSVFVALGRVLGVSARSQTHASSRGELTVVELKVWSEFARGEAAWFSLSRSRAGQAGPMPTSSSDAKVPITSSLDTQLLINRGNGRRGGRHGDHGRAR